jgi:hypothetical protein
MLVNAVRHANKLEANMHMKMAARKVKVVASCFWSGVYPLLTSALHVDM